MQTRLLLCALGLSALCTPLQAGDYEAQLAASRETVKQFMQSLKDELQSGMQEGGPVNAISTCNLTAPGIANTYSIRNGWDVGRTSLKLRNPGNLPDAWERGVLESFEARKQAGEDPATMEHYEVIDINGGREFRYMKAIPTGKICLVCHGEQVDVIAKQRIDTLYPHDQATGFKEGDIRGAFTITQPLQD